MEHTKHLWRAVLILGVILIGFVVWRHFMIPESFGMDGHYRYDSLLEFMAKPARHGNTKACVKCHADEQLKRSEGKHASVSCETCHAPLAVHVKNGEMYAPMPKRAPLMLCAYCHQKLRARPKGFPQVDIPEHISGLGLDTTKPVPPKVCKVCHDPHQPEQK